VLGAPPAYVAANPKVIEAEPIPRKMQQSDCESIRDLAWENRNLLCSYRNQGFRRFCCQDLWQKDRTWTMPDKIA
jgi:hypothetical protein